MKDKKRAVVDRPVKKVKMKFGEDKYYNDLKNPCYIAGVVYDIEGTEDWINRWIKRGGVIVDSVEAKVETVVKAEPVAEVAKSEQAIDQAVDKEQEVEAKEIPAPAPKTKYKNK